MKLPEGHDLFFRRDSLCKRWKDWLASSTWWVGLLYTLQSSVVFFLSKYERIKTKKTSCKVEKLPYLYMFTEPCKSTETSSIFAAVVLWNNAIVLHTLFAMRSYCSYLGMSRPQVPSARWLDGLLAKFTVGRLTPQWELLGLYKAHKTETDSNHDVFMPSGNVRIPYECLELVAILGSLLEISGKWVMEFPSTRIYGSTLCRQEWPLFHVLNLAFGNVILYILWPNFESVLRFPVWIRLATTDHHITGSTWDFPSFRHQHWNVMAFIALSLLKAFQIATRSKHQGQQS